MFHLLTVLKRMTTCTLALLLVTFVKYQFNCMIPQRYWSISSGCSCAAKISVPAVCQASTGEAADRIQKKSHEGEKSSHNSVVGSQFLIEWFLITISVFLRNLFLEVQRNDSNLFFGVYLLYIHFRSNLLQNKVYRFLFCFFNFAPVIFGEF